MDLFFLASLQCCVGCVELWISPSRLRKRGHGRMCGWGGWSTRQPVEAWLYVVNTQFSNL
ncbi:unnamed protein product [Penicillium nalgiovense]|uniref:Uncharacterized protein n=1 Tax=Penicillium nalgiovense TaxID=60175 RepID=A0A9W4HVA7_PENNA|nr:unnamed protein product [Penicillium nalgiovense]CAG8092953.1 unnamed protein product [Penicillium nalgiovense]CAG8101839.1 unnamed protein product [Penicillium nalgiovense]CAG8104884.1 unnamed protein product [Penicillium nalgiovense]CAG8138674.1 unnamed protein product [Penicillium nalgiovense]